MKKNNSFFPVLEDVITVKIKNVIASGEGEKSCIADHIWGERARKVNILILQDKVQTIVRKRWWRVRKLKEAAYIDFLAR